MDIVIGGHAHRLLGAGRMGKALVYRWVPARIVDGVPRPLSGADRRQDLADWRSLRGCTGLKP